MKQRFLRARILVCECSFLMLSMLESLRLLRSILRLVYCKSSLIPRPMCVFHFSAAVGLVFFLTCVTQRVEGWWKGKILHGRGQLQFSGNEGRQ